MHWVETITNIENICTKIECTYVAMYMRKGIFIAFFLGTCKDKFRRLEMYQVFICTYSFRFGLKISNDKIIQNGC